MALIKCPECAREISDKAPACPGCGAPAIATHTQIENSARLTTIQKTSMPLKRNIIISGLLFWGGFIWLLHTLGDSTDGSIASLIMIVGLFWYLIARFNIWWQHK